MLLTIHMDRILSGNEKIPMKTIHPKIRIAKEKREIKFAYCVYLFAHRTSKLIEINGARITNRLHFIRLFNGNYNIGFGFVRNADATTKVVSNNNRI